MTTSFEERMAAERAHDRQMHDELLTLAQDVASELGQGWSAQDQEPDYPLYLVGPDGAKVYLRFQGYRQYDRLDLSTADPDDVREAARSTRYGRFTTHREISVAWGRGAKVTAREITRRLLPGYFEELATVRQGIARDAANASAAQELADELAALVGQKAVNYRGEPTTEIRRYGNGWDSFDMKVNHDGSRVTFEASMTPDQARRVAALLTENQETPR